MGDRKMTTVMVTAFDASDKPLVGVAPNVIVNGIGVSWKGYKPVYTNAAGTSVISWPSEPLTGENAPATTSNEYEVIVTVVKNGISGSARKSAPKNGLSTITVQLGKATAKAAAPAAPASEASALRDLVKLSGVVSDRFDDCVTVLDGVGYAREKMAHLKKAADVTRGLHESAKTAATLDAPSLRKYWDSSGMAKAGVVSTGLTVVTSLAAMAQCIADGDHEGMAKGGIDLMVHLGLDINPITAGIDMILCLVVGSDWPSRIASYKVSERQKSASRRQTLFPEFNCIGAPGSKGRIVRRRKPPYDWTTFNMRDGCPGLTVDRDGFVAYFGWHKPTPLTLPSAKNVEVFRHNLEHVASLAYPMISAADWANIDRGTVMRR